MRHPFEPLTLIQIPKRAQPPIRVGNPIEEAVKDFLKAIKRSKSAHEFLIPQSSITPSSPVSKV